MTSDVSIPNRARFKPSEVCTIAGVQPYILRSWEAEFPALGTGKGKTGGRIYRRADVELVLKIKSLVFGEGLTLGAARRRLEGLQPGPESDDRGRDRGRRGDARSDPMWRRPITAVRQGLRDLLEMLGGQDADGRGEAPRGPARRRWRAPRSRAARGEGGRAEGIVDTAGCGAAW